MRLWTRGIFVLVITSALSVACRDDGDPSIHASEDGPTSDGPTTASEPVTTGPTSDGPLTTTAPTTSGSTDDGSPTSTVDDSTGEPGCVVSELVDAALWDELFLHKDDPACFGGVYTWQGLVDAAADYPTFACEGDALTRRRELAAFLAQISHETTGGWAAAPDGPYSWGLCFLEELGCEDNACPQYCDAGNVEYPCAAGKTYHGRGAIQLSWNYNYGQAGDALGVDLLSDPDLVASDSNDAILKGSF